MHTDGLGAFNALEEQGHARTVIVDKGQRTKTERKGARWVNVVLANIKRSLSGAYHALDQHKYARRYLAEAMSTLTFPDGLRCCGDHIA